jgi:hypothetical protein
VQQSIVKHRIAEQAPKTTVQNPCHLFTSAYCHSHGLTTIEETCVSA